MRKAIIAALATLLVVVPLSMLDSPVTARPSEQYSGTHFGADNFPPGCIRNMAPDDPANTCFHMRTGLNALDSPDVDVLVMVPVSPTAERDMRIMRQSVEMWENGIHYLAGEMGLDWLDHMDFHITVDYFDPTGGDGGEFTTYPVVDPEIVVIATNPVGGIGIGIDPVATGAQLAQAAGPPFSLLIEDENGVPCHNIANPFDFQYWENLPGFNDHHHRNTGTYTEDCGGKGGNVCFAINGAIDPAPDTIDIFNIFDLVSHEFGHCLTLGHVGDGAESPSWGPVPTNDIMSYNADPPGRTKCVSTLDVEGVAVRMSHYLDTNGDARLDGTDHLEANDQIGRDGNAFIVQSPKDHLYASGTGSPMDCPQPDVGLVPGPRTEWTPTPVDTVDERLTVDDPVAGPDGAYDVSGTVERVLRQAGGPAPTSPTGSVDDAEGDGTTPLTDITHLGVGVTASTVDATIDVAQLWPAKDGASATSYSLVVNGRQFDSFIYSPTRGEARTWDGGAAAYVDGISSWDTDGNTVTFHIPRAYLADAGITSPYFVSASANFGGVGATVPDDRAPDGSGTIGVANARVIRLPSAAAGTVTFEHKDGNHFTVLDSQGDSGILGLVTGAEPHRFHLDLPASSDVVFTLKWTDNTGVSDLDLHVQDSLGRESDDGATAFFDHALAGESEWSVETVTMDAVKGGLDITVDPYLITDPVDGTTYTLTAAITPLGGTTDTDHDGVTDANDACPSTPAGTPSGCPDGDGDGVTDEADVCPGVTGNGADGCPMKATERVHVLIDGARAASRDVDTSDGPDRFAVRVFASSGPHELKVVWEDDARGVLATKVLQVGGSAPASSSDSSSTSSTSSTSGAPATASTSTATPTSSLLGIRRTLVRT